MHGTRLAIMFDSAILEVSGLTVGKTIFFPIMIGRQLCKLPGCMKDCYVDDRNKCTYDFCAKTHASQYKQQIRDIYIFGGYGFNGKLNI